MYFHLLMNSKFPTSFFLPVVPFMEMPKNCPLRRKLPFRKQNAPMQELNKWVKKLLKIFVEFPLILVRFCYGIFNPAGAHESALIGEAPSNKANNLVPVITETAIGKRESMTVFGDDYDTRDGSCVRDYIHVMDLANAHTKCLQYLTNKKNEQNCEIFNVGLGDGATVLEAVHAFEKTTGQKLNYKIGPRRAGDVVAIYSNVEKAATRLEWSPKRKIEEIMLSAWNWEVARSK